MMIGKKRADLELPLVGAVGGGLAVELVDGDLDLPQQQTHSAGVGGDVQDLTVLDVQHKTVNTTSQTHGHTTPDRSQTHGHTDTQHRTGNTHHRHTDTQHWTVNTHLGHTDTWTHGRPTPGR